MDYINTALGAVLNIEQIRKAHPHISIPNDADLTSFGYAKVHPAEAPQPLPGHRVEAAEPVEVEGRWQYGWRQVPLTDAEKAERAKAGVPSQVAMRQARLALLYAGLLDDVQPAIDSIPDPISRRAAQIEWEYSSYVERDKPLVAGIAAAVGLSVEQVWDLLKFASTL